MPTTPLPERPNLDHLRTQARTLQRAVRAADPGAIARVAAQHPDGAPAESSRERFPRSAAQLVVAHEYGFASWARLKHHVDLVTRYTRVPDETPTTGDPASDLLRFGCLVYSGEDGPARWAEARRILRDHPEVRRADIRVAAALADVDAVHRLLRDDPAQAARDGGPHGWAPLLYLAYSRVDPDVSESAVVATARALLDAGADPNAGFLHHGLPTPFTVLTGTFGEGERGPRDQPRHPHSHALARVLLDAGADPNDGQTLYNRMFEPDDDHLVLLFEHGLGTGSGGPWRARLGAALDAPAEMVRGQLAWAVTRNFPDRVRLLVAHGVDVSSPFPGERRTPVEVAALHGNREIVEILVAAGAAPPALSTPEALAAAALAGDRDAVDRLVATHPGVAAQAMAEQPTAVLQAATAGRRDAVSLLVDLGFDVNAGARRGEGFVIDSTALHHAATDGDLELVRLLVSLGADLDAHDAAFDATPLGWARHADQPEIVAFLESRTSGDGAAP